MITGKPFRGKNRCIPLSRDVCSKNSFYFKTNYVLAGIYENLFGAEVLSYLFYRGVTFMHLEDYSQTHSQID